MPRFLFLFGAAIGYALIVNFSRATVFSFEFCLTESL
jgi:hypothetical protein